MADTPQRLSPEEMLQHLRHLLADLNARRIAATDNARVWTNHRKVEGALTKLQAANADAEWCQAKAAALEEAIALSEVLSHPDFYQLEDFGRDTDGPGTRAYASIQRLTESDKRHYRGATTIEVLLAVHEVLKARGSLKESTPAPSEERKG